MKLALDEIGASATADNTIHKVDTETYMDSSVKEVVTNSVIDKTGFSSKENMESFVPEDATGKSDLVLVYGTAILEDSFQSHVENTDVNSIIEVIDSKDHLRRNVEKISLGRLRNYDAGELKYRHEVEFIFTVRSSSLWESPRAYLWKHLGTSEWTLRDGKRLSFVRIHRKYHILIIILYLNLLF